LFYLKLLLPEFCAIGAQNFLHEDVVTVGDGEEKKYGVL